MRNVVFGLLALAACHPVPPVLPDDSPASLAGTEWVLQEIHGTPPLTGSRTTLVFEPLTLGGYGGCNWYGGRYSAQQGRFDVEEIAGTARLCGDPPGVSDQEKSYLEALGAVTSYARKGGRLDLRDRSGSAVLSFTRRHPLAMNPADLVGTKWRLAAFHDDPVPPGAGITLDFAKTHLSGFAGCRDYTGTWRATGDRLHIPSTTMLSTECNAGHAALWREGRFTTDLSEASYYRLGANALEITTDGGRRLVFTRRE